MGLVYVAMTVVLTVYGQLIIKWQIDRAGNLPEDVGDKATFLLGQLLNPWILSGFAAAFLASLAWMASMTQLPLSYAYPFMSLAFVMVMLLSAVFLGEALTAPRVLGTGIVMLGLIVLARGGGPS